MTARSLPRRIARVAVRVVFWILALLGALLLLVLIALDTGPGRDFVRKRANAELDSALMGQVTLEHIGRAGLYGVAGVDVTVRDPAGRRVLIVRGLRVETFWPSVVWSALTAERVMEIPLDTVSFRHADVTLSDDGSGRPTLARAFEPEPTPGAPPSGPSPEVRLRIARLAFEHAWVHGDLVPSLDAEASGFEGALSYEAKGLVTEVERVGLLARALPAELDPKGTLSGRLELPSEAGPRGGARFAGEVAGARVRAEGRWDGVTLHASLDAPSIPPETLNARVPALAVREPLSLRASAHGRWPDVSLQAELSSPAVHATVRGNASFARETSAKFALETHRLDLSGLVRGAPPTELEPRVELSVRSTDAALEAEYLVALPQGEARGQATPRLAASGRVRQTANGDITIPGELTLEAPGATLDLSHKIRKPPRQALAVHVELSGRFQNAPRLAELGVRATGTIAASADFDAASQDLRAQATLRASSVEHESVRARNLAADVTVGGTLEAPRAWVDLTAGPLTALGRRFDEVALTLRGSPERFHVNGLVEGKTPKRAELSAAIALGERVVVGEPRVVLPRPAGDIVLTAESVTIGDAGAVQVTGLSLRGAGRAFGRVELGARRDVVELTTDGLDVSRLGELAGIELPFERLIVTSDVSLARAGGTLTGRVRAEASGARIEKLGEVSAEVDLELRPRDVSGSVSATLGDDGRFRLKLENFVLPREPGELSELLEQPGLLEAEGAIRLSALERLLRGLKAPIERMSGSARFDVRARGGDGTRGPTLTARVETRGLSVVEKRDDKAPVDTAEDARKREPRALEGVDFRALLELDPKARTARTDIEAYDLYGTIATLEASAELPVDWTRTLVTAWRSVPVEATLEVPRRSFEIFPSLVKPSAQKGVLGARIELEGSWNEPKLEADLVLDRMHVRDSDEPLYLRALVRYAEQGGRLALAARARGADVGELEATWQGDLRRLPDAIASGRSPVVADLAASLRNFPTESVPALFDRQIEGPLCGEVRLRDLGRNARLDVSLDGSKLSFGRVELRRLEASVEARDGQLRAKVLGADSTGRFDLDMTSPLEWGDRLVPRAPKSAEGRFVAQRFPLEVLNPALTEFVNELGGRLDADLAVKLEPGNTELQGQAALERGVLQLPAIGQRLTDMTARVRIRGDRVLIDDVSARGITGRLTARASLRLDGLALRSAHAHVTIPKNDKIPVTLEGAALGDAWGRATIDYEGGDSAASDLRIKIPRLHVELAEQGDLDVQSLDDVETIRIGARQSDGSFAPIPLQPLEPEAEEELAGPPLRIRIELGKDVEIERGRQLRVQLTGELVMIAGREARMTGRLELRQGTLDVQGKLFTIERGVVTFGGDPANPTITATARWDAPVGYAVFAEYRGDVENGKIVLRSEPPLTQDEIASLILFGTPDGGFGASSSDPSTAAAAVGVAGETAARGINRAISELTNMDIAARVDTSTGSARPELVVQVSPRVSARVTRAIGEPQAGQPPDQTFLTLEFRLTRSWSLSAVVGDHGASGVDVIWRRRY